MRKYFHWGLILTVILTVVLSGCSGGGGGNGSGGTTYTPGQSTTHTVGSVSFEMHYVPAATIPGSDPVANAFWMADTEVTRELWNEVRTWGTTGDRGYTFANPGTASTDDHPVGMVSWRDAMVWCNALTEYYNEQNGMNLACVYIYNNRPIKNSDNVACDSVTAVDTAKGFRLPSSSEWELAARYIDGTNWTPPDYASGATAAYTNAVATGAVAWYSDNSGYESKVVGTAGNATLTTPKTGNSNALRLYDMNGNLWEWCFDQNGSNRKARGGSFSNPDNMVTVSSVMSFNPTDEYSNYGFRPVRTQ